jgi:hypothetical protein
VLAHAAARMFGGRCCASISGKSDLVTAVSA